MYKYFGILFWKRFFNRSSKENLRVLKNKFLEINFLSKINQWYRHVFLYKKGRLFWHFNNFYQKYIQNIVIKRVNLLITKSLLFIFPKIALLKFLVPNIFVFKFKKVLFKSKKYQFLIRYLLSFKKAKKNKLYYSNLWSNYIDYPKVTVIVSVFNHDYTASHIAEKLINNKYVNQIIILEDGSTDNSYSEYRKLLKGVNHFILSSNDLNTLRTYDKAIKMSNSEFIVIMQDDDLFPEDEDTWLSQPLELFDHFQNLGLVGGWNGIDLGILDEIKKNEIDDFKFQTFVDKYGAKTINPSPAYCYKFKRKKTKKNEFDEINLTLDYRPLHFSPACDIGPYIIRKSFFEKIGGVDFSWGEPGKSSCWWDIDLCYRFWENGYEVINFPMHFHKGQGVIGSDQFYQKQSKQETLETNLRLLLHKRKKIFKSVSYTCEELNKNRFKVFR